VCTVSAEPGAVRVSEFRKEQKRGKVKMTGDVLTTARDSEHVEKGGDEEEIREAQQLCDPDEVLHVGKGDRPKEGVRSREKREKKGTQVKKRGGKQATEIVCLPGPDEWGFYSKQTDRQILTRGKSSKQSIR
jgi:hypothetical protein